MSRKQVIEKVQFYFQTHMTNHLYKWIRYHSPIKQTINSLVFYLSKYAEKPMSGHLCVCVCVCVCVISVCVWERERKEYIKLHIWCLHSEPLSIHQFKSYAVKYIKSFFIFCNYNHANHYHQKHMNFYESKSDYSKM